MRLEVEEQVVSSLLSFVDKAIESFSGIKMDKAGSSKLPAWSLLRWNRFNGQEQFTGRPWRFEVVQVPTNQNKVVKFSKVVKQLEEYRCWAATVAVEPIGGPLQKLPLLAKEKTKVYIEILHISPIELTVRFVVHLTILNFINISNSSMFLLCFQSFELLKLGLF